MCEKLDALVKRFVEQKFNSYYVYTMQNEILRISKRDDARKLISLALGDADKTHREVLRNESRDLRTALYELVQEANYPVDSYW